MEKVWTIKYVNYKRTTLLLRLSNLSLLLYVHLVITNTYSVHFKLKLIIVFKHLIQELLVLESFRADAQGIFLAGQCSL